MNYPAIAFLFLSAVACFGSSEESKYKYFDEKVLSEVARDAQVIIRGRVIMHRTSYYVNGKETSLDDAKKVDSGEAYAETIATIRIEFVLKGPIGGSEITLRWKDPIKTDCPHIPMTEHFMDGIWFTRNHTEKAGNSHNVDWMPARQQEKLNAAVQKWAEQDADGQAAAALDSKP
jgi:hypothetical protein